MLRAAMPETAIDKDSQSNAWENKIGRADNAEMASPTLDSIVAKYLREPKLGDQVASAPNPRHDR